MGSSRAQGTGFERGLAAYTQYIARTSQYTVPGKHQETVTINGTTHTVRLDTWVYKTKTRTHQLRPHQRASLADLALPWASTRPRLPLRLRLQQQGQALVTSMRDAG